MKARYFLLIGCLLIHTTAYGYPKGYKEMTKYEIYDPEEYMEINKIDIPDDVAESCEKYGAEYGICPELVEGLCWRESRCKSNAKNGNCKGIAQIDVDVHTDRMKRLKVTNIYDTDQNIHVAFDLLSELYKGNMEKALDAYNGNNMNGKSEYTKSILKAAHALELVGGE